MSDYNIKKYNQFNHQVSIHQVSKVAIKEGHIKRDDGTICNTVEVMMVGPDGEEALRVITFAKAGRGIDIEFPV